MMLTFFINSFYNMKNILNLKERGRSSVGRYHTKQQTLILEYLALKKDTAFTAESVWRGLLGVEEKVGRATVYRALDRLVEAGTILKIPSGDGNRALYRYCSATSFLRNWDSILEKKRANLRSISEPARLRQPPPQKHGSGTRKRAGSKHTGGATNSRPSRAFCPLVG